MERRFSSHQHQTKDDPQRKMDECDLQQERKKGQVIIVDTQRGFRSTKENYRKKLQQVIYDRRRI